MRLIICEKENKEFNTYKQVADFVGGEYQATKRFFTRNKNKSEIIYKGFAFKILYMPEVSTLLKRQWENAKIIDYGKTKSGKVYEIKDLNLINKWEELVKTYPEWKEYQEFLEFLYQFQNDNDITLSVSKLEPKIMIQIRVEWRDSQQLWMCDTETTFTGLVPNEYLFKDINKSYGNSPQETIANLHLQQITDKKKLAAMTEADRVIASKKGIKDWFKDNPKEKPYMWAWNAYNFETKEYHLLNYYEAADYLNNLPITSKHLYHNLSYDFYYVVQALIDEYNYSFIIPPEDYEERRKWKQPPKTITVLANDNKILQAKISNSLGRIITMECTYLKTMSSVDNLGKILKKPKLNLNYMTPRGKNHVFTKEEEDYIFTDVDIVVTYLSQVGESYKQRFNKKLTWGLTIGMTSFGMLKKLIGKTNWKQMFECLNAEESEYLRKGIFNEVDNSWSGGFYNGGYTNYNIKYVGIEHFGISSLDIKSSYPDKWQHYKMPYGSVIYDCDCNDLDYSNDSAHFKLYELEILEDIKIQPNKENMIPVKIELEDDNGKKVTSVEYYPFMQEGKYPVSQYMAKIFLVLFNPKPHQFKLVKTMCFQHKIIKEFKEYDDLWQAEKETNGLKKSNPAYYDLCKLFLNGPTGKFGQKEITTEYQFSYDENNIIDKGSPITTKEFEDLSKFSYLPVIIATTDIARLHLLSLIETVGWDRWHNSDTDSCKFWLPEEFEFKYNPSYMNLIVDREEPIYNKEGESVFGKWEHEWKSRRFKCSGKKKYMYEKWDWNEDKQQMDWVTNVVCAGAPNTVKKKMTFETFFVGYNTTENDKNRIDKLNGMPVILPTSFKIDNVFRAKNYTLASRKRLLHDYYIEHLDRLDELIDGSRSEWNKEVINYENTQSEELELERGVDS